MGFFFYCLLSFIGFFTRQKNGKKRNSLTVEERERERERKAALLSNDDGQPVHLISISLPVEASSHLPDPTRSPLQQQKKQLNNNKINPNPTLEGGEQRNQTKKTKTKEKRLHESKERRNWNNVPVLPTRLRHFGAIRSHYLSKPLLTCQTQLGAPSSNKKKQLNNNKINPNPTLEGGEQRNQTKKTKTKEKRLHESKERRNWNNVPVLPTRLRHFGAGKAERRKWRGPVASFFVSFSFSSVDLFLFSLPFGCLLDAQGRHLVLFFKSSSLRFRSTGLRFTGFYWVSTVFLWLLPSFT